MIDVMKYQRWTALFSLLIMVSFFGVAIQRYVTRGAVFLYSVDFEGGTEILLKFETSIDSGTVRTALENAGWQGVATRKFSSGEILVRIKEVCTDTKILSEKIVLALQKALSIGTTIKVEKIDSVGTSVGDKMQTKSFFAIVLSLVVMSCYLMIRFWSLGFAIGAAISLFHDALIVLAVFLFLDREISQNFIGAVLTVLGYSVNDTIVIFARIRDNIAIMHNVSMRDIINLSINQTLRRTILTSAATTLTVLSMLILGGEALRDLSLALLVGVVFGTYSSIYIASPIKMLVDNILRKA